MKSNRRSKPQSKAIKEREQARKKAELENELTQSLGDLIQQSEGYITYRGLMEDMERR